MAPTSIMLIRHGEKPGGVVEGVTQDGTKNHHELIVRGWQRAGALGRFFLPFKPASNPVLPTPTALYAPKPDSNDESVRAGHTLLPLASLMDPENPENPEINLPCAVGDEEKLAEKLLEQQGNLLVAWEHKHIKDIVKFVTGHKVKAPHWPGDRFDMVYLLSGAPNWTLTQVPQMLLAGDKEEPFPAETTASAASGED